MIPDLKQDGKLPVPNAKTKPELGTSSSRMLGTLLFPDFSGKWHSGTQTSIFRSSELASFIMQKNNSRVPNDVTS